VIGEPSKNAKCSQCFKCQGYGYVAEQCPSRNLLVREADGDEIETVVSTTDSDDDVMVSSIQLAAVRCHIQVLEMRIGINLVCFIPILHMKGRIIS